MSEPSLPEILAGLSVLEELEDGYFIPKVGWLRLMRCQHAARTKESDYTTCHSCGRTGLSNIGVMFPPFEHTWGWQMRPPPWDEAKFLRQAKKLHNATNSTQATSPTNTEQDGIDHAPKDRAPNE